MTRTCKMKDGSTKVIKKVATKELEFWEWFYS
jgi:hypothetical protein